MKTTKLFFGHGLQVVLTILFFTVVQSAMAKSGVSNDLQNKGRSGAGVTFQFVGRNFVTDVTGPGAGKAFTVGYYTYIAGIPQPLFSDLIAVGEATAYFTFRSEPYSFSTFANDDILVRTVTPGFLIKLYYNQTPDQTFDDPDTFSNGQLIATFRVITSQATRVVDDANANEQASLTLISTQPFSFQGKHYTIRKIVHNGVSLISAGSAVINGEYSSFAYAGTALAY
jgi:hypothetical protein